MEVWQNLLNFLSTLAMEPIVTPSPGTSPYFGGLEAPRSALR